MKKIFMLLFIGLFIFPIADALDMYDYGKLISSKADITSSSTVYEVCNPSMTSLNDNVFFSFKGDTERMTSYNIEKLSIYTEPFLEIGQKCSDNKGFVAENLSVIKDSVSCTPQYTSRERSVSVWEREDGSVRLDPGECQKVRVTANYKASTEPISIDNVLNFKTYSFDKWVWWNTSFNKKYQFNISTYDSNFQLVKISLNSSFINFADCSPNGSDVRIVNQYENATLPFNISYWNTSHAVLYINYTAVSAWQFYLYCNNSAATPASQELPHLFNQSVSYYNGSSLKDMTGFDDLVNVTNNVNYSTGIKDYAYVTGKGAYLNTTTPWGVSAGMQRSFNVWGYQSQTNNWAHGFRYGGKNNLLDYGFYAEGATSDIYFTGWGSGDFNTGADFPVTTWQMITIMYDGTNVITYVNGSYVGNVTKALNTANNIACIGVDSGSPADTRYSWIGLLDEFGVWNRTLTKLEIGALHDKNAYPFYFTPEFTSASMTNHAPVVSINATMNTDTTPFNVSFNCTDADGDTTTKYVFINGSLNTTTSGLIYVFNSSTYGIYNISITCGDGILNSSNYTMLNYSSLIPVYCAPVISGLSNNSRYQDVNVENLGITCSNNVSASPCNYSIEGFTNITPGNCSKFNITLEMGYNTVMISSGNTSVIYTVWAKKLNASIADYAVLIILILAFMACIIFAASTRLMLFLAVAGIILLFLAFFLIAMSITLTCIIAVLGFIMIFAAFMA